MLEADKANDEGFNSFEYAELWSDAEINLWRNT